MLHLENAEVTQRVRRSAALSSTGRWGQELEAEFKESHTIPRTVLGPTGPEGLGGQGAVTDSFIIQISRPFCSQMCHYLWKENICGMHVKCSDNIFMSHFFAKESLTASGNSFVSLLLQNCIPSVSL